MTLVLTVVLLALAFEFVNGFHDTANSIATVVSTKVLTPRQAILLAAFTNLLGAFWGTAVAKTIASGLVDVQYVTSGALICALLGAIIWNLITWRFGLPSSSSHALIGGLCGAVYAAAHDIHAVIWTTHSDAPFYQRPGILWKVIVPMFLSPLCGFIIGFILMALLYFTLHRLRPRTVNLVFGKLQILSAGAMGFMHGTNDAQKTMGLIALALLTATQAGTFVDLPSFLAFLRIDTPAPGQTMEVATWIKVCCAIVMAAGTAAGGWRIIRTLGHKIVKLQPIHGFAAETSSSVVIFTASHFGIPISTTHNISASILGVGAAKRLTAVRWHVVEQMVWAWILTLPCAGGIAYFLARIFVA